MSSSTSSDPLVNFERMQPMPTSIDSTIRLMDTLQPNCQFYDRQKTKSRGDCSQLRAKLREYAMTNKDSLGVKHWVDTKNWEPPNDGALSALMVIIRDIIDTSWPMMLKQEEEEVETNVDTLTTAVKKEEEETDDEDESTNKRQKLDIPTLTEEEKSVVLIQYKKDNNPDDAEAVLAEYEKFMYIKIKDGGDCAPPKKIDAMWHAHILSTRQYFAFCDRCNKNKYIHHNPTLTNGRVLLLYKDTLRKYAEYFGHEPRSACIWPKGIGENCESEDEDGESEDGDGDSTDDDAESWSEWHTAYANKYKEHPNKVCPYCNHDWANGEFDIECEDCVGASMDIDHEDEPDLISPFGRTFTCG